ncbi:condensation domain-containing protein [Dactylosporangium sp. NPDC050688]|uniref:condensation domain-containing protein n=1 Tax=Dactylosporangium sp. NPDC050688 TaxID=3157217 RepID=UPI0033E7B07F
MAESVQTSAASGQPWVTPASFAQERVWFASQLTGDVPVYHVVTGIPLAWAGDVDGLLAILAATVGRHEPLRTAFRLDDGVLRQVVHPAPPLPVERVDLTDRPVEDADRQVEEILDRLARVPLPLSEAPLWRAVLARRGAGEWLLLLGIHHAVFDAASEPVLRAELGERCAAATEAREPDLPELPVQYADWAAWQRDRLTERYEELLVHWRAALADLPPVHGVPLDHPRPAVRRFVGGEILLDLPVGFGAALAAAARTLSTTPYALLLAGWVAVLHRCSDRDDVVLGIRLGGRDRPELAGLIGMFVNLAVVRVQVPAAGSYRELAGTVRAALLDVDEHQVPYQKLVEAMVTTRLPGVAPLQQIGFNHLDAGASRRPGAVEDELMLEVTGGRVRLEYDTALFEPVTAQRIAAAYTQVMPIVLSDPDVPLAALPVEAPTRSVPTEVPTSRAAPGTAAWIPPRTVAEELVAGVWSDVLGRDRIGALDNFFDLGGHSLLALRVIGRLSALAEVPLTIQEFFTDVTVAGVAATLERLLEAQIDELDEDEAAELAGRGAE